MTTITVFILELKQLLLRFLWGKYGDFLLLTYLDFILYILLATVNCHLERLWIKHRILVVGEEVSEKVWSSCGIVQNVGQWWSPHWAPYLCSLSSSSQSFPVRLSQRSKESCTVNSPRHVTPKYPPSPFWKGVCRDRCWEGRGGDPSVTESLWALGAVELLEDGAPRELSKKSLQNRQPDSGPILEKLPLEEFGVLPLVLKGWRWRDCHRSASTGHPSP